MSFQKAHKAFSENLTTYVDLDRDPALYNLNVGLLNMSEALLWLQGKIDDIDSRVRRLER